MMQNLVNSSEVGSRFAFLINVLVLLRSASHIVGSEELDNVLLDKLTSCFVETLFGHDYGCDKPYSHFHALLYSDIAEQLYYASHHGL